MSPSWSGGTGLEAETSVFTFFKGSVDPPPQCRHSADLKKILEKKLSNK